MKIVLTGIKTLFRRRKTIDSPADASDKQMQDFETVLDFAGSSQWPQYQEYIEYRLGREIEDAFNALGAENDRAMYIAMARAQVYHKLLQDVYKAHAELRRKAERLERKIKQPTS